MNNSNNISSIDAFTSALMGQYNWVNEAYSGVKTEKYKQLALNCIDFLNESVSQKKFRDYTLYKVELLDGGNKGVAICQHKKAHDLFAFFPKTKRQHIGSGCEGRVFKNAILLWKNQKDEWQIEHQVAFKKPGKGDDQRRLNYQTSLANEWKVSKELITQCSFPEDWVAAKGYAQYSKNRKTANGTSREESGVLFSKLCVCNLENFLNSSFLSRKFNISKQEKEKGIKDLIKQLDMIHEAGYYIGDIKPENILLKKKEDGSIGFILNDLGVAKREEEVIENRIGCELKNRQDLWDEAREVNECNKIPRPNALSVDEKNKITKLVQTEFEAGKKNDSCRLNKIIYSIAGAEGHEQFADWAPELEPLISL